ncbi:MAG TPA: protein-disulfide reductase DsbD domain-containing protein [Candidatus Eisenbacteria bacterium]|nr:protein-disulfide reductase DsbD domain-containing protein [Candidatus Eisenbacteria bacterium]
MIRPFVVVLLGSLAWSLTAAQQPGQKVPTVAMAPVGKVQVRAGGSATVDLDFRIENDFHINSNHPKSELLIPTALQFKAAEPVKIVKVNYPAGQDVSFPFAPTEKLSVYSGDFTITATVKAPPQVAKGTYPVTGELRFQACDRSACYPPRSIPVMFDVTVIAR